MVEAVNKIEPAPGASGFTASDNADKLAYEDYARCIHCGLCLNHCPTYRQWGLEADSPRGRIRQMLLVDQGKLELGDSFVRHIDRDRKSTRLNSSHVRISYAVFCLQKKKRRMQPVSR